MYAIRSYYDFIAPYVKIGVTTLELNDLCHKFITDHGAISAPLGYRGYPKSICTSVNHEICHGIPSDNRITSYNVCYTKLLRLRIATGLKIEELGSIAKIEPSIIDALEIGRGEPNFNALVGLAKFYDKRIHISLD